MTFNTTSYLAGVGSVVAVLSTGFAGGYFLANPTRIDPPNRLQRLAAESHDAKSSPTQNSASRAEILRRPLQYIDKCELRFLAPVQRRQQHRALDLGRNAINSSGTIRQLVIKLA